jgi:uncharacterized repeat protein (TIGR03943 family)
VDRLTQFLVLILLGAITLRVALTDAYLAYVQPGFRPLLVLAAIVLLVLGLIGAVKERPRRRSDEHQGTETPGGDSHHLEQVHDDAGHHAPRVAWLLLLPVAVLLLIAPPALGSFTASRQGQQVSLPPEVEAPRDAPNDPGTDHWTLPVATYSWLALAPDPTVLEGRRVRLVGFVTPRENSGWYVTRIGITCCAADAVAFTVTVDAPTNGLAADDWVEVIGTYAPPQNHPSQGWPEPVIEPLSVKPIDPPANTYDG